jgi:demethylmenaquinone methyltransferase/2-methoxy-6-polyprenyl-1,4-benzoquinol methylase
MTYQAEKIVPYNNDNAPKSVQVRQMFNEIAPQYDFLNHTLSLGIDRRWRKKGIMTLKNAHPQHILDIATGTGDFTMEAYKRLQPKRITGIDISEKMMEVAQQKIDHAELSDKIDLQLQDCSRLSFDNDTFDAATVAFGIRNFENLDKCLQEILRVLRPNGQFVILELSTPERFPMKQAYHLYSKAIIPLIGRLIANNKPAYNYLPKSIKAFPQNAEMKAILEKNGFAKVTYKKLTCGICTLYTALKK